MNLTYHEPAARSQRAPKIRDAEERTPDPRQTWEQPWPCACESLYINYSRSTLNSSVSEIIKLSMLYITFPPISDGTC
jgi:hypothetical protein